MFHSAIRHKASWEYDTGLREFQLKKMNNDWTVNYSAEWPPFRRIRFLGYIRQEMVSYPLCFLTGRFDEKLYLLLQYGILAYSHTDI